MNGHEERGREMRNDARDCEQGILTAAAADFAVVLWHNEVWVASPDGIRPSGETWADVIGRIRFVGTRTRPGADDNADWHDQRIADAAYHGTL